MAKKIFREIDFFDFTSFFGLDVFNFLAHCDQDTVPIGGLVFLMKKLKENGYGLIPKGKKHALKNMTNSL